MQKTKREGRQKQLMFEYEKAYSTPQKTTNIRLLWMNKEGIRRICQEMRDFIFFQSLGA